MNAKATWTALTGTNTAIRALDAQKLQVANATTLFATKASWAGLTGTNTALRLLISDRMQVANAVAIGATKASWAGLTGTNTALRTLISDRLQVANASATYLTKNNPVVTGTLTANSSTGTAGYYLRTSGTGVYWSPASSGGGSTTQYLQVANAVATYATKASPTTSGLLAHTGRVTISTNLTVTGNTSISNFTTTGFIKENVFTITDGASVDINPTNGTIQLWTLGASRTPTATNFLAGQSITLMIDDGTAYAITWTSLPVTWVGGSAPTLATTGYTIIELWKVSTTIYGALVGNA